MRVIDQRVESNQSSRRWFARTVYIFAMICMTQCSTVFGVPDDAGFQSQIAPLLRKHCLECHGVDEAELDLNLMTRTSVLVGSKTGPVVTPGRPDASLLIQVLAKGAKPHMPPEGQLSDDEIAQLRDWVAGLDAKTAVGRTKIWSEDARNHWAFQPVSRPRVPALVQNSKSRNGVDRFVEARLAERRLTLSESASRETLCRRLHFDLTGLPPTLEELAAFVDDDAPEAYERLVERLLASPRYGERWGRHWLDLARYADSSGFHSDLDRPHAWRYRDYVINSFNMDRPYAEFVRQQLAGDETPDASLEDWIATGFCRNGPSNEDNMGKTALAREQYRLDELDDVISTTSNVFLGLTLGCARCHDHKFDPLAQRDYYRFLAYFSNASKKNLLVKGFNPAAPNFGGGKSKAKTKTVAPAVMVFTDRGQKPRETHLLWRGQAGNKGPQVAAGIPQILSQSAAAKPPENANANANRSALAEWIASPDNPLTWRVMANRVWQHHFGRGLVATPSNFGRLGERPSHPKLLDFLALELLRSGGRIKSLHRLIVTSATYRQGSQAGRLGHAKDPTNVLLWRQNKRRLEAEALRDAILAVAGSLNFQAGGPGIKPRIRADLLVASQRNKWPSVTQEGPEHWRRSVYVYVKRQLQLPMLELFDAPSTSHSCARRSESLVPTQALVLMNDEFVREQAAHFAARVSRLESNEESRVALVLNMALGRAATAERVTEGVAFCKQQTGRLVATGSSQQAASQAALTDFCHVVMNLSEFVYID